jgi:hypothetical protein
LETERDKQQAAHNEGRARQTQVEICVQEVRGCLTHGSAEYFDDPEVDGDFWYFIEKVAYCGGIVLSLMLR